jgi:hypothetical protein
MRMHVEKLDQDAMKRAINKVRFHFHARSELDVNVLFFIKEA